MSSGEAVKGCAGIQGMHVSPDDILPGYVGHTRCAHLSLSPGFSPGLPGHLNLP